jgi:phospholipid/cholesterol/gamma-HCH transport system permease protein
VSERLASVECKIEGDAAVLCLVGAWRLRSVPTILGALRALSVPDVAHFVLDGSSLESIDTAGGFVLLMHLAARGYSPTEVTERHFDPKYARLLALVRQRMGTPRATFPRLRRGLLQRIGVATIELGEVLRKEVGFVGAMVLELLQLARRPALFRPRETVSQFEAVCVDAIPIVVLINFLIGVVVAYVLGIEARRYGADLFVADGVVLAMCRELSPILGSVLVAGRSGAAFTAHIGTMKVEEEVDAIATLGLSPAQVLVIPRLLALIVAMPLLVLVGDIAGILGGMMVCSLLLHIVPEVFIDRVHAVLEVRHLFVGLGKAPVFAVFIGLIACRMGLDVKLDARSVGENTTSTVVQCIVWVIVLDAAFAVVFQRLGI